MLSVPRVFTAGVIMRRVKPNSTRPEQQPLEDRPAGYQPSLRRKLFMLGLCVVGLIVVWAFYLFGK